MSWESSPNLSACRGTALFRQVLFQVILAVTPNFPSILSCSSTPLSYSDHILVKVFVLAAFGESTTCRCHSSTRQMVCFRPDQTCRRIHYLTGSWHQQLLRFLPEQTISPFRVHSAVPSIVWYNMTTVVHRGMYWGNHEKNKATCIVHLEGKPKVPTHPTTGVHQSFNKSEHIKLTCHQVSNYPP